MRMMRAMPMSVFRDKDNLFCQNDTVISPFFLLREVPEGVICAQIEEAKAPDEWALNICKSLGYQEYWNPPGGQSFFDSTKYQKAGIKLVFQQPKLEFYSQRRGAENFEPGLSIIDVMMFNSPEQINQMLDKYELITPTQTNNNLLVQAMAGAKQNG